jgi:predicted Zn-dependent protease
VQAEEELFKKTVKKFSQSPEVWTLFAQFYLTHGRPSEARELLPRSLKSLEKRDRASLFRLSTLPPSANLFLPL